MSSVEKRIRQWLRAERRDRRWRAERRLGGLLRELPDLAPAPGFTARVLAACGLTAPSPPPALRWLLHTGWVVEALALLAVGVMTLLLPGIGRLLPAGAATALAAAVGERLLLVTGHLLTAGARSWTGFAELGELVGQVLRTPLGAGLVMALLVCGYTLLWSLDRLLSTSESAAEGTAGSIIGRNAR